MLHPSADSVNRLMPTCHTLAGYYACVALLPRARTCAPGPIPGTYPMPYALPVHARSFSPSMHPIAMHLLMHPSSTHCTPSHAPPCTMPPLPTALLPPTH